MTIYLRRSLDNPKGWTSALQAFLVGTNSELSDIVGEIDDDYGSKTESGVREYQKKRGLQANGVVGADVLLRAIDDGFDPPDGWLRKALDERDIDEATFDRLADVDIRDEREVPVGVDEGYMDPAWPAPADADGDGRADLVYVSAKRLLGEFAFEPNPESKGGGIIITDGWDDENIVSVSIPQLAQVRPGKSTRVRWHRDLVPQLLGFWQDVEDAALLHLVLAWAGSFVPRFIRGSTKQLSNHAWGSAFDINPAQNGLGRQPALVGQRGSVRQLVGIAEKWGFRWGGFYSRRKDGMHFEAVVVKTPPELLVLCGGLSAKDHIYPWINNLATRADA